MDENIWAVLPDCGCKQSSAGLKQNKFGNGMAFFKSDHIWTDNIQYQEFENCGKETRKDIHTQKRTIKK